MANCCSFGLVATGFKSDKDREYFKSIFSNDFGATDEGCNTEKPYMALYDGTCVEENKGNVFVYGMCKWSVSTSMLDTGYGYYSKNNSTNYTCLNVITEQLGITVEVYSTEPGMCFAEHYIIDKGEVALEEEAEYTELYLEESWEDFVDDTTEELRKKVGITNPNKWADVRDNQDYVESGGFESTEWTII